MKILIDLQACQSESRFRGIGRYADLLVKSLVQAESSHEFHLLLNGAFVDSVPQIRAEFSSWIPLERTHVFFPVGRVHSFESKNQGRIELSQMVRDAVIASVCPDVLLLTSVIEGFKDSSVVAVSEEGSWKVVSIVYDMIPLVLKETYLKDATFASFYWKKLNELKKSDYLLAISRSSAEEAVEHLGFAPDRVTTIGAGLGIEPSFLSSPVVSETLRNLEIKKPFVLYAPGGYDPRKNVRRLVQAWMKLPVGLRSKYQLVFGSRIADRSRVEGPTRKEGLKKGDYIITDYVDDRVLVQLYKACNLFVFPSLHEGFGLPVLEAMACGAPVIGSNSSSIPEIIGWDEALFDPLDVASITSKMQQGLEDLDFQNRLRASGKRQVKAFSWSHCAEKALKQFDRIASEVPRANSSQQAQTVFGLDAILKKVGNTPTGSPAPWEPSDLLLASVSLGLLVPRDGGPRLYIDVSALVEHDARTGIQRVVRAVLQALPVLLRTDYQIVLVYGDSTGRYREAGAWISKQKGWEHFARPTSDEVIDARAGDIFLGLDLSAHLFPVFTPEVAHLRAVGVKVFFVIYDLIPLMFPEFCDVGMVRAFRLWMNAIARNSDGLFCISQSVSEDLEDWIDENVPSSEVTAKIGWFHLGADFQASRPSVGIPEGASDTIQKLQARPTFLMVGTIEPRKGHRFVLDAFDSVWQAGLDVNLVFVGKLGWKMEAMANIFRTHSENGSRFFWLDGISDEFLEAVYSHSTALLAASEAEGFGLPIIEAAQRGLPVIAREIAVFREVAQDGATYFDGDDPQSLARVLKDFLDDSQGLPNRAHKSTIPWLTWEESTKQLLRLVTHYGNWT